MLIRKEWIIFLLKELIQVVGKLPLDIELGEALFVGQLLQVPQRHVLCRLLVHLPLLKLRHYVVIVLVENLLDLLRLAGICDQSLIWVVRVSHKDGPYEIRVLASKHLDVIFHNCRRGEVEVDLRGVLWGLPIGDQVHHTRGR